MLKTDSLDTLESIAKPRKRLFEAGHMKLLVLHLISQAPKFSYDIIKDVGAVVGGGYSPSTGTIYPTLNYLEEQQYIIAEVNADERKQYHITASGIQHLVDEQSTLDTILTRFNARKQIQSNEKYIDINRAMENLKASLRLKILHSELSAEQVREIADKIDQAAVEISRL
ncbi:PadR family transcriptional regulator [Acinetobacter sp. ANC 5054]|uniref:PadR family transcriptional regulator n=1 Tax=Acinetobacter sp. ANC 5054 TaxID=1977877 RepID=UPI000A34D5C7|nr:PadR family transcriptional regulator [Acinetobacter sp. ANC 5054]OTG79916.1 PadR family transcriptional regulator [Acinetobacter sp. ANC 5054]